MSDIKLVSVGSLKVGNYIIIDNVACVIKKIDVSSPGKHGHAKYKIEAVGIIDGNKRMIVRPSHDKIEVPIIEKKAAQVLSITGDKVNVMDMETYETFDLEIPEELKGKVKEGVQIVYWIIMKDKVMKEVK